jgi:2-polyprenyl-3-methyl-5-hydroxy-6-metoxy-1,4-benzoquinol methylase
VKVLVTIANYGSGNDRYLARVLDEFRGMREEVDIVVTSNVPKDLGQDVEVIVGLPAKNPRSLPFAHKDIFAKRRDKYDLFIYVEDDILITQRNIDAFLQMTRILPENEYAGFFRTETDASGRLYFPDVHRQYHWDAGSVCSRGDRTFAFFTNEHSGCYVLTRDQLHRAIASEGFLVPFHEGQYEPLESAATDPFTQCGFRKLICISHLNEFLVPHLSNKYAGKECLSAEEFYMQIRALPGISNNCKPQTTLFPVETKLYHTHWSKNFYEPRQDKLIDLVPQGIGSVLSVGCGWGETEKSLIEKGIRVKAVPIDSVIAVNAEARGVEIVYGNAKQAREKLAAERFDCILFSNVLHLVRQPTDLLASFAELVAPGGVVIASTPNLPWVRRFFRELRFGKTANPKNYDSSGMHISTARLLRRWFQQAGLKVDQISYEIVEEEKKWVDHVSSGLAKSVLGSNVYVSGSRLARIV